MAEGAYSGEGDGRSPAAYERIAPRGGFDWQPAAQGLYDPRNEKDSCGVGMVAELTGVATRNTIETALGILENLDHRGARGSEKDTGDGAGMLCSMPHNFMQRVAKELAVELPPARQYAVGNVFLEKGESGSQEGKRIFENVCSSVKGLRFLVWRHVPVASEILGKTALKNEPAVYQAFIAAEGPLAQDTKKFEAALFVLRKRAAKVAGRQPEMPFYVCSLSCRVITYKGMLTCPGLVRYYADLREEDFHAHVALVHSRFSTNTFPAWRRAHPFRYLCHNGEINTLRGNINSFWAREGLMRSELLGPELQECFPLIELDQTDSGIFDNVLEVLTITGRSLPEAVAMMMPQAWENATRLQPELRDYYKFHSAVMEPWDGPALICFTDGDGVGASLDRNGLRPCRYCVTRDRRLVVSSECGVVPINPADIVKKGRLSPGKMLWCNFGDGRLLDDAELKAGFAAAQPWGEWISQSSMTMSSLHGPGQAAAPRLEAAARVPLLKAFGYSQESLELLLVPMGQDGEEALGSMGNDVPLACFSKQPRSVFDYFYQLFAQVTNPPIDPIRESIVMSLGCWIGPEENMLAPPAPHHVRRLWLDQPCLLPTEMEALSNTGPAKGWRITRLDATFPKGRGPAGLEQQLGLVSAEAQSAVDAGCQIIVLTDRAASHDRVPIPALLCIGAVHHALVGLKKRARVALVVESGEPHEVAHHALLLTFGADAVCPYMAYEALRMLREEGKLAAEDEGELFYHYQKAVSKGLLKVMAKMGISTLRGYKGAQIADAIGLNKDVVDMCFRGVQSPLSGIGFEALALRALALHERGFHGDPANMNEVNEPLANDGQYNWRQGENAERHMNDPMVIAKLQEAARTNSRAAYASFAALHNSLVKAATIRGQLDFKPPRQYGRTPISLDAVEPSSDIVKRFRTGAMSYGSISLEAHATLGIAMNRIGGFSNTGEGGEDPLRFQTLPNGDSMKSAIKQVASGRFGVTMEYLSNAQELQIKIAQGAKPGEGGELPGKKVQGNIARTRYCTPGVGLISPPPHHDIYSIEDLAQLIFDLKNANPDAGVSVKLVSEVGVGVVATGVAKCKADHILISGNDGGTGASKWTGIKHAGAPWELGLAETHQTLVLNGLRGRVTLETDGQLRTGRDVVIAALLGAERFGFATAPLIAMGCIMMRKCHLNTCPVGIATQDPVLREKFAGMPEHVVNYLMLVAEEVRVLMAKLGFRSMDELIGHADALRVDPSIRGGPFVFTPILTPAHQLPDAGMVGNIENRKLYGQEHFFVLQQIIDRKLYDEFKMVFRYGEMAYTEYMNVNNTNRSIGTLLSHELYKRWGKTLLPGTAHAKMYGTSGQSFGAFSIKGVFLELEGESQDYFGKGLSGGALAVYPPRSAIKAGFQASQNIIIGNTSLYGATGGVCFVNGIAAERFGVRNSGVWAMVEGVGDHCCEYMTGGRVAVLGAVGDNFGAGMSGGVAWVWDPSGEFERRGDLPKSLELSRVDPKAPHPAYPHDVDDLHQFLGAHNHFTGSTAAFELLQRWPASAGEFLRVFPLEYMDAVSKAAKDGQPSPLGTLQDFLPKPHGPTRSQVSPTGRLLSATPQKAVQSLSSMVQSVNSMDIEDIGNMFAKGQRPKTIADDAKLAAVGKGFLDFDRADLPKRSAAERAGDFHEILATKDEVQVRTQAARCMDCGTPFCHQSVTDKSGCPLGNLIPEWNRFAKEGAWHEAFKRLMQTNNFPEFTGRVCPAPCEGACVLGIIDDPVAIKSVELTIIDKAYENGWMRPFPPAFRTGKKIAIIGSGPSGLAAADQLNKMGHHVTVYERADRIGGLMMYGVPNMKTDKVNVVQRRVDIMESEGITFVTGPAGQVGGVQEDGDVSQGPSSRQLMGSNHAVLLAVGATVGRDMQAVPGRDLEGIHLAMHYLKHNTKSLLDGGNTGSGWRQWWGAGKQDTSLDANGKTVVVIGGGDTGNDCIGTAVRQGAKQVINLELLPQPPQQRAPSNPWPHWPVVFKIDYGHEEAANLDGGKDIRRYSVSTKEFVGDSDGNVVGIRICDVRWDSSNGKTRMVEVPNSERVIKADLVLLALGFTGPEHPLAESFGVDLDQRGNYSAPYQAKETDFRTSNPKVFAAGDCRRGQSLVVWAIKEGRDAAAAINRFLVSEADPLSGPADDYAPHMAAL